MRLITPPRRLRVALLPAIVLLLAGALAAPTHAAAPAASPIALRDAVTAAWRAHPSARATEATLAANRGLAAAARLQPGQRVTLVAPARRPRKLVHLWD